MNEYQIVAQEFLTSYGSISSSIISLARQIVPNILPVLFISAACSIAITFYRNIVK